VKSPFFRIVKVGGSLFDLPDLGERLHAWLKRQQVEKTIFIAGGGPEIDDIRQQSLDDVTAHWRCITVMNSTAELLVTRIGGSRLIDDPAALVRDYPDCVFAPLAWMKVFEPLYPGTNLPKSWDVTSDSIAARLAICTGADELVLLKSADPPSRDLQELADAGYVDKFLPKLAGELPPWRIVNLRNNCP
jgi:aspartokinase-like uncharacterized kinase